MKFTLDIDPACLSTAQQKMINFKRKVIVSNPRVVRSMKLVKNAMLVHAHESRRWLDEQMKANPKAGVYLAVIFRFAFPKGGTKKEKASRYEGQPVVTAKWGDLDNRQKAFQDALVRCGAIPDDHFITTLLLRKRFTFGKPRIDIGIAIDDGLPKTATPTPPEKPPDAEK